MSSSSQPDQAIINDGWESSSSSSSSSAGSPPCPPLPDSVLRSFQFPNQQRAYEVDGNAITTHLRSAGNSAPDSRSVQTDDRCTATMGNGETREQEKDGMNWSRLSNNDLDLIIANLEARASERRNKIRKIEALSEELGLSIRQQDWAALLNRPLLEPSRGMVIKESRGGHEQMQAQPDAPQNVEPVHISETGSTHDSVFMDDSLANTSSNVQAESERPLQSQRLLRSLKRTHDQLAKYANQHEDRDDKEIPTVDHPRSPVQTQTAHSEFYENAASRPRNSSLVFVDGVAKRTAWSIVLETHPDEIATRFRPGERPKNKQFSSMLELPAVNALVKNPMRRGRTQEWHIVGLAPSRQILHLVSILIQITGVAALDPCEKCQKGCGLWAGCYLRPANARGVKNLVCANCMYNNKSTRCRWKKGSALP